MDAFMRLASRLMPQSLRNSLKRWLERRYQVPSIEWSLLHLRDLGFSPRSIIDVGAFQGEWSLMAHRLFPSSSILMLEAQQRLGPHLEAVAQSCGPKVACRIALLGAEEREGVVFHEYESAPTASSVLQDGIGSPSREVFCRMRTLDGLLRETGMPQPDFIKLDVQGYELEVLKGAAQSLAATQAVLMEVSLIELYRDSPLLPEVIVFMRERGFRPYDICSLLRRPLDQALCQVDMIFLKADSFLFRKKEWGA